MDEPAFIYVSSAGGKKRSRYPVRVVGLSGDRYRCRLLVDARLPGKAWTLEGEVLLVPKYAVIFEYTQPDQLSLLPRKKEK